LAMAVGARDRLAADVGLATTGVAGPGPADGHDAGTVLVAVSTPWSDEVLELHVAGDRSTVREASVDAVIALALGHVTRSAHAGG
ncbi:MAG TPA: CinA family protein, partial [Cellulomonas sp.]|nr:CinA family protein [Cellulomonas sp.]